MFNIVEIIMEVFPKCLQHKLIWFDLIWIELNWIDLIWFDLNWFGLIWFDLIWLCTHLWNSMCRPSHHIFLPHNHSKFLSCIKFWLATPSIYLPVSFSFSRTLPSQLHRIPFFCPYYFSFNKSIHTHTQTVISVSGLQKCGTSLTRWPNHSRRCQWSLAVSCWWRHRLKWRRKLWDALHGSWPSWSWWHQIPR